MAVYFTAFFLFFFYLAAVPVKFVFIVQIAARPAFAMGASIFEGGLAGRRAARSLHRSSHRSRCFPAISNKTSIFRAAVKMLAYLLRKLRVEKLQIQGRIGTDDAARTALICASAYSLESALVPLLPRSRIQLHPEADFTSGMSDVMLLGMFSLRAGHIITAALIGAWNYFYEARSMHHGKTSH